MNFITIQESQAAQPSLKALRRGVDDATEAPQRATIRNVSRRRFLQTSGGLALAVQLAPLFVESAAVADGVVWHSPSTRQAHFGQLAAAAATQPVPASVTLKSPKDFKLIGKTALRRVDGVAKTNGTAVFTQDIKRPGMLVAVPAHPT